ncbi:MAG: SH3 domain-containing protein [Leptospirales bacterium]|nr:SH3 domain-containing protein [Leptospirales bacterium]
MLSNEESRQNRENFGELHFFAEDALLTGGLSSFVNSHDNQIDRSRDEHYPAQQAWHALALLDQTTGTFNHCARDDQESEIHKTTYPNKQRVTSTGILDRWIYKRAARWLVLFFWIALADGIAAEEFASSWTGADSDGEPLEFLLGVRSASSHAAARLKGFLRGPSKSRVQVLDWDCVVDYRFTPQRIECDGYYLPEHPWFAVVVSGILTTTSDTTMLLCFNMDENTMFGRGFAKPTVSPYPLTCSESNQIVLAREDDDATARSTSDNPPSPTTAAESRLPSSGRSRVTAINGLLLRKSPSVEGEKTLLLPSGAEVKVQSCNGPLQSVDGLQARWCSIEYQGHTGWAFGGYLERLPGRDSDVWQEAVIDDPDGFTNVRNGPSLSSPILGTVKKGEVFETLRQQGEFWRVRTKSGLTGFMHVSRIRRLVSP